MILDRTLPTTWTLYGCDVPALAGQGRDHAVVVENVETLCASIVGEQIGKSETRLEIADLYESVGFLLGQVVVVLQSYDPTRGRRIHDPYTDGFKAWLHLELTRDLIDYWRSIYGRKGQKHVFDTRPFEREEEHRLAQILDPVDPLEDGSDSHADRRIRALGGVAEHDPDAGLDGREWAVLRRDRKAARKVAAVGLGAPRAAPGRHRAADQPEPTPEREELVA